MTDIEDMKMVKSQLHSPVLVKFIDRNDDDCCDYSWGVCLS